MFIPYNFIIGSILWDAVKKYAQAVMRLPTFLEKLYAFPHDNESPPCQTKLVACTSVQTVTELRFRINIVTCFDDCVEAARSG